MGYILGFLQQPNLILYLTKIQSNKPCPHLQQIFWILSKEMAYNKWLTKSYKEKAV